MDETPRKIHIHEGGLPIGYELENVNVHIYERGHEVATNLSSKRVDLTREEAFQFMVIDHISQNRGRTLPASAAMATVTPELRTRLRQGEGQQIYYVKVSKEGLVTEVFGDEEYSKNVEDRFFVSAVKRIWFKPALENGEPVESKTSVDVTKLLF